MHDFNLAVTDLGLPPEGAGYTLDPDHPPVANTTVADLRVVVRAANAAPALIAVLATGATIAGDALAGTLTTVTADEGVPVSIELSARDGDLDFVQWTASGLPTGMTMEPSAGSDGQTRLVLRWTPGLFAAQGDNANGVLATSAPGRYRLLVNAGDGGATQMALLHDADTPAGVSFDPSSGTFEWTPDADTVNNAQGDSRAFTLRFSATDGSATTLRTVQVRVFDVNRPPEIVSASHAALVGQSFALPIVKGASAAAGSLRFRHADGATQTQNLVVSFSNLPEGASYDAQAGKLLWTPGPGQVGDFVVLVQVSDGRTTTTQTFTLRVVAEASANAPKILIDTTPGTPVLPGQAVLATVRADAFIPIRSRWYRQ